MNRYKPLLIYMLGLFLAFQLAGVRVPEWVWFLPVFGYGLGYVCAALVILFTKLI